jgi:hypothetical protein
LWRAALEDLRDVIRRARARGFTTDDIQDAAGDAPAGRFVRVPAPRSARSERSAVGAK